MVFAAARSLSLWWSAARAVVELVFGAVHRHPPSALRTSSESPALVPRQPLVWSLSSRLRRMEILRSQAPEATNLGQHPSKPAAPCPEATRLWGIIEPLLLTINYDILSSNNDFTILKTE